MPAAASRARRHVQADGANLRSAVDPVVARRVTDKFISAASTGNLHALLEVLDPEAAGWTDPGADVPAPRDRGVGAQTVAERFIRFLQAMRTTLVPMPVNHAPGAILPQDGAVIAALAPIIDDERITAIQAVANPHKLTYVRAALGQREPQSLSALSSTSASTVGRAGRPF